MWWMSACWRIFSGRNWRCIWDGEPTSAQSTKQLKPAPQKGQLPSRGISTLPSAKVGLTKNANILHSEFLAVGERAAQSHLGETRCREQVGLHPAPRAVSAVR